ncbi:Ring finger domain [seawater metagenome]|uniref:Ring finger domain n=1 Tax=seawater metagenome TaxID=1561972 RepID=A0A5E8CFW8_9ZZZZ
MIILDFLLDMIDIIIRIREEIGISFYFDLFVYLIWIYCLFIQQNYIICCIIFIGVSFYIFLFYLFSFYFSLENLIFTENFLIGDNFLLEYYIQEKELSNTLECSICLEKLETDTKGYSICDNNHYFHASCLKKWIEKNPSCPLCRTSI